MGQTQGGTHTTPSQAQIKGAKGPRANQLGYIYLRSQSRYVGTMLRYEEINKVSYL